MMEETVGQWVQHAEEDLETARALVASKRNLHALFFCQQAIEKALKAIIQIRTKDMPPRIHNLARLAEMADVPLDPARARLLAKTASFYIQSRYPDQINEVVSSATHDEVRRGLKETEEMVQWLRSILK